MEILLERESLLAQLGVLAQRAGRGAGQVVLLRGEAGVGKSAVIRRFIADLDGQVQVLRGSCDPLATPRPLGPLIDMLAAFICFSQAIRLMSHVGMMISVPTSTISASLVSATLIRAGRYHTLGMRCYYYAAPLLFWLFGPLLLLLASCGLVGILYQLDKSPARAHLE